MRTRLLRIAAATVVAAALAMTGGTVDPGPIHTGIFIRFEPDRVTLEHGRYLGGIVGTTVPRADETPKGGWDSSQVFILETNDANEAEAGIAFEIVLLGEPTGYWVQGVTSRFPLFVDPSTLYTYSWWPRCVLGRMDGESFVPLKGTLYTNDTDAPFVCTRVMEAGDATRFIISLKRHAEIENVLSTKDDVSLIEGRYDFNNIHYRLPGAATVPKNSETKSSVISRPGDKPREEGLTRGRFQYRIVDAGKQTAYWVVGWTQVEDKWFGYQHQAMCFVTDFEPGSDGLALDTLKRDLVLPYECRMTHENTFDSNSTNTYRGIFEVGKRP